jgi:hypothetical protein
VPTALAAAVVACLAGLGVGLLWRAVAPRVEIIKVEQGFVYAESQPEQAVAADSWFALLGLIMGLVLAVVAWAVLRRRRGLMMAFALVVGSLVGAWLGWWLGVWLDEEAFRAVVGTAQVGDHLRAPLSLGMSGLDHDQLWPPKLTGVVLAQPLGVAIGYTTLAGFSTDPLLRPTADRTWDGLDLAPVGPAPQWATTWPPAPLPAPAPEPVRPEPDRPGTSSGPVGQAGPTGWPAPPGSG